MNNWYNIKAAATADGVNEVFVYEDIGAWGVTASSFVRDLQALSGKILVRINSLGGDVFDAIAIHSYLSRIPDVETVVDGIAASAASIIFAAGKVRKMSSAAYLMIHNPWSFAMGGSDEMRQQADLLDKITGTLASIYRVSSSKEDKEIREMMDAETWMTGEEAKASGFATEIVDGPKPKASVRADRYSRTPKSLLAPIHGAGKTGDNNTMKEKILALLGVEANARETFLVGAFAALGVDEKAIDKAQASGDQSFLSALIEARITDLTSKVTAAEARAGAHEGIAKALLASAGITATPKDAEEAKTLFSSALQTKASAEASEILASRGITKPLDNAKASAGGSEMTVEQIKAKFAEMPAGPERTKFFAQHKKVLF